jgi:2-polyprenyl-6-methoxyphenol hydroxylase-like FAD-dependent oxidoreductase
MSGMIIGGGIVGLTTALMLHRSGIKVRIFEEAVKIRELGLGLNVLPHSVAHLVGLGLQPRLDAEGVRTGELCFFCKNGKAIWQEPRGMNAGYEVPQYSIHRGRLQALLKEQVIKRIGSEALLTDRRLVAFENGSHTVTATFENAAGETTTEEGEFLIGADGINSMVRSQLYPDQSDPHFAGLMLWRGTTITDSFLSGKTMVMAGHSDQKVVVYPISEPDRSGKQLINWVAEFRVPLETMHRDDWNREGLLSEFADRFSQWKFDWMDIPRMFENAEHIFKFPMVDRDPIEKWSFGRVTLAGDAAHAMYPNGSNGASQGILDAVSLEKHMSANSDISQAFTEYEKDRLPPTSRLTLENRKTGPEKVLQLVEDRCDGQCGDRHTCVPEPELKDIAQAYKKLAGFDKESVNKKAQA